eukprot:CAMPEP_0181442668 /NCGR_PEP_ID=MMETSP1110-20121109/24146_1 /TAXON_ID=174948 /ORGANISM="Symbiodinium sp., Strain CCMP421" /LENGTH=116 /DNA_ID=CAMNT_0023566599 /DNA_START=865 /DNA_END=1215 /DNA_ORIENTATION=+
MLADIDEGVLYAGRQILSCATYVDAQEFDAILQLADPEGELSQLQKWPLHLVDCTGSVRSNLSQALMRWLQQSHGDVLRCHQLLRCIWQTNNLLKAAVKPLVKLLDDLSHGLEVEV